MTDQVTILTTAFKAGLVGREFTRLDRGSRNLDDKFCDSDGNMYLTEEQAAPLVDAGYFEWQSSGTVGWILTPAGIAAGAKLVEVDRLDLKVLCDDTLTLAFFHPNKDAEGQVAIPALYDAGDPESKLVLVLGENAGGKSFFRRLVRSMTATARKGNYGQPAVKAGPYPVREMINLSMQGRTGGGMMGSFIYGNEAQDSTGDNSAHTVTMGIKTATSRAHRTIVYWDEPDIGMSAGSAAGAGMTIREMMDGDLPLVQGVFITSHSPALVHQLSLCKHKPHYLYLGNAEGPATLEDWFQYQRTPTPVSPTELHEVSRVRRSLIQKILNRK